MSDAVTRTKSGQFAKGWSGGPGRPAGQRNRLTETVTTFLSEDFELHGRDVIEAFAFAVAWVTVMGCDTESPPLKSALPA